MTDPIKSFIDFMEGAGVVPANRNDIKPNMGWKEFKLATDKGSKKRGSYILDVMDSGYAKGTFINFKDGNYISWNNWEEKELDPAELEKIKEAAKKQREEAKQKKLKQQKWAADKAQELYEGSLIDGISQHPYIISKQIRNIGLLKMACVQDTDPKDEDRDPQERVLLIPAYKNKKLVGLQKIYEDGSKKFIFGTDKEGSFTPIAQEGTPKSPIVICEGYATGDAIHSALGHLTLCCFDAGNLENVATYIKKTYPSSEIIIAADNDQWTEIGGKLVNVGLDKASALAKKLNIKYVYPDIPKNDPEKRTDFNDLYVSEGVEAVKKIFSHQRAEVAPIGTSQVPVDGVSADGGKNLPALMEVQPGWNGLPFIPLGIDTKDIKKYWYYDLKVQDIVDITVSQHKKMDGLMALALPSEWRAMTDEGEDRTESQIASYWSSRMISYVKEMSSRFSPSRDVRGVGAWLDAGRVVTNCGKYLYCDGVKMRLGNLDRSKYVYTSSSEVSLNPADEGLSDEEAKKFYDLCQMLNWEEPLSGVLFAGWVVCSLVSGSLPWRPHIWICAEVGTGKSTIKDKILLKILGDFAHELGGSMTTEPGVRAPIKRDPRPVILDDVDDSPHIDKILQLARISSSAQKTGNADGSSEIRSCFCILSVLTQDAQYADKSRFSVLNLEKDNSAAGRERYKEIKKIMEEICNPTYARKLHRRIIDNMPALFENINTFKEVAEEKLSSARDADQVSAMLAGAVLLHKEGLFSMEEAQEKVDAYTWERHTAIQEANTGEAFIDHIMSSTVRIDNNEKTLGLLINIAGGYSDYDFPTHAQCEQTLANYGIIVHADGVAFKSKNPQLKRVLQGTPFEGRDLNSILTKLKGVTVGKRLRFPGMTKQERMTLVPWRYFIDTPEVVYELEAQEN